MLQPVKASYRCGELRRAHGRPRIALALGGGGVIGGMYEVGALAALEERLNGESRGFDVYVGCSAGSVVAALLASGVRASDLHRILDQDIDDPLNFGRGCVYCPGSLRRAVGRIGRLVWAFGRTRLAGLCRAVPKSLALPAGFFSLAAIERFMRTGLASRGLSNRFEEIPRRLLIPAIDLDRAERTVFGVGALRDVPISDAVAASSAIPGFFEPYPIGGRDYVDGGVGSSGHADLAAAAGADVVFVVHPLVPHLSDGDGVTVRSKGLYAVLEQANRITSHNLLELGLANLSIKYPKTSFFLLKPRRSRTPLFGPSMSFDSSRQALCYGYTSTQEWLASQGQPLLHQLLLAA